MSRQPLFLSLAAVVCLLVSGAGYASDAKPTPVVLENEFVRVVVNQGPNEAARFSITTTGGDPSRPESKNKRLIFGGNKPWTSYSTVRIDGVSYVVGGPTERRAGLQGKYGKTLAGPTRDGDTIVYRQAFDDVEVTQQLGFVRGMSTRMLDTVGITYTLTNTGAKSRQVGLRVMLDTMCGDNDGAPIRAGRQAISTATMLHGEEIPDFWQAFDNLASPTVISQGSMRGASLVPPDKLFFADWGTFADEPWEPKLTAGEGFIRKGETDPDTAMAMLWNPVVLEPGQSVTHVSYYGIGEVTLKPGRLTLGLTAPAETTFRHERSQRVTLTGYLQNVGGFAARDVTLKLDVPEGLSIVKGDSLQATEKLLQPNETVQKSWVITPNGKASGMLTLRLSVTSSNIESNEITREIQVFVPQPKMGVTPSVHRVQAFPEEPVPVVMELNLAPADNFNGASVTLQYDPKVIMPLDISRGRAFVDGGRRFYWRVDKSQARDGLLTITGRRIDAQGEVAPSVTQAEANLATIQFRTVNAGTSPLAVTKAVLITESGEEVPVEFTAGSIEVTGDIPVKLQTRGTP